MRKFLAVLLILIFIPLYVTIFLAFNLQAVFFDEEVVKESLNETGFYEKIVPSLIQDTDVFGGDTVSVTDFATEEEILDLINTSIPPNAIKLETEKTIDAFYPYFLSETDSLKIEYDVINYKNTFSTEAEALVVKKYDSLKECTKKQLEEVDLNNLEEFPACRVPGVSGKKLLDEVAEGGFSNLLDAYPDKIIVTEQKIVGEPPGTLEFDTSPEESFANIRTFVSRTPRAVGSGFGILIALLVLLTLLRWGSWKSISKWVGWILLVSSIIAGISSFGLVSSASFIESALSTASEPAALAAQVMMNTLDKMFYSRVLPQTIVIVIVSLALIIIPLLIKTKDRSEVTT